MATSLADAFKGAEDQKRAKQRVAQRVVADAATKQGRRIQYLEIYASWDEQTMRRLERILAVYMRDHGVVDLQPRIGGPDDFIQEAINQTLRWPGELWSDDLQNLVLFLAKRNVRAKFGNAVERREESLARPLGADSEKCVGDLLADSFCDEDAMNAPIELWYVNRYIRDLLEEGRDDDHICAFLDVRPVVVKQLREHLREELEIERGQKLATGWSRPRCMKVIRDYAAEHEGYGPTKAALNSEAGLPTAGTLIRLYGSRRRAMEEAGVLVTGPGGGRHRRLDKVDVSERLVEWVRTNGHWPSQVEVRKASAAGELVSPTGFRNLYGANSRFALYSGALKTLGRDALAGIEPPPNRYGTILPRVAVEAIVRWKEEHGRWPGQDDFDASSALIGKAAARRIFGSLHPDKLGAAVTAMLAAHNEKEMTPA